MININLGQKTWTSLYMVKVRRLESLLRVPLAA